MSEETEAEKADLPEAGAGQQEYKFINDDKMLRCFVFEVIITHCQEVYDISEYDLVYHWVRDGQVPDRHLKLVKKD